MVTYELRSITGEDLDEQVERGLERELGGLIEVART